MKKQSRRTRAHAAPVRAFARGAGFTRLEDVKQFALSRDALSAMVAGDHARAEALLRERLALAGGPGDEAAAAAGLNGLGERVLQQGHSRHAIPLHRLALALYRRLGNTTGVAWSLQFLGEAARYRERWRSASVLHERALSAFRALGDGAGESRALSGLASIARYLGEHDRARTLARESLHAALSDGDTRLIAISVAGFAGIALDTGRHRTARLLLQAVRPLLAGGLGLPGPEAHDHARDTRRAGASAATARAANRWRNATTSEIAAWLAAGSSVQRPVPGGSSPAGVEPTGPQEARAFTALQPQAPWPPLGWQPGAAGTDDQQYHLALLRAQSETSLDGIIVVSTDATIALMNQRFVQMWGIPSDVAQRRLREGVTARVMEQVADPASYLARSDHLHHYPDVAFSAEVALKDGRVLEHYSAPVSGADGTRFGRIGYYRDVTERKQAAAQLSAQRDALRRQVAALREARAQATRREERLRREIAEMLHSQVQTQLVVAHHRASRALERLHEDPAGAEALLRQLCDEIDDIRENGVRRASHLLHPTVISLGLVSALAYLQERFRGTLDITAVVDRRLAATAGDERVAVPESVALAAYRVIEEALANVSRHAGVAAARVELCLAPDGSLETTVSDTGKGFIPDTARGGLGLLAIGSRVDEHGGAWSVGSTPGSGTTLTARFPLAPNASLHTGGEAFRETHEPQ